MRESVHAPPRAVLVLRWSDIAAVASNGPCYHTNIDFQKIRLTTYRPGSIIRRFQQIDENLGRL